MDKINLDDQKTKPKKKGLQFYFAVGICMIAVGVAIFTAYDSISKFDKVDDVSTSNVPDSSNNSNNSNTVESSKKNNNTQSKKNTSSELNNSISDINDAKHFSEYDPNVYSEQDAVSANASASGAIVYPTSKEVIKKFSGDNPVFSKTLNDWRVHNGVDLAAEQGSKVKAITDGQVKDVYNDSLLGMTIVIDHNGGFTAYYSGLSEGVLVNVNDKVKSGQDIATINNVPSEISDGSHLHLAIKKDNKFIDPVEVLG